MTQDERGEALTRILDARRGRSAAAASRELGEMPTQVRALIDAADILWVSALEVPPLNEDPTAILLGLVPDPEFTLDGKALGHARKRAGLQVGDLARRLSVRGWDVKPADVFRWEQRVAYDVPPAIIRDVALEVRTDPAAITRQTSADPQVAQLRLMFDSNVFLELVQRWARLQDVSVGTARSMMESRALAAVHRGGAPDPEIMLQSLEALVDAVEQGRAAEQ